MQHDRTPESKTWLGRSPEHGRTRRIATTLSCALLALVFVEPSACKERCESYVRYDLNDRAALNVSGYDAFACEVTFSSPTGVAQYVLPPVRQASPGESPPPAPTLPDEEACDGFDKKDTGCQVLSGPRPRCERVSHCLRVMAYDAAADAMRGLLGTTYDVTVSCGGVLVYEVRGRSAERELCPW